jgi:hypothetical protein
MEESRGVLGFKAATFYRGRSYRIAFQNVEYRPFDASMSGVRVKPCADRDAHAANVPRCLARCRTRLDRASARAPGT